MKTTMKSVLIIAVALGTAAFTNTKVMTKKIDIKESNIVWTGKKVLGAHTGNINLKEGYLEVENGQLNGGMFVVDMTSINVTDLSGESKGKLEGHLRSDDFFGIEKYPTATLVIKNAKKNATGYTVNGDLTIKGITEPVTFNMNMNENSASTTLQVDRTKYGVRYGSGSFFDNLGDNTIEDMFELKVNLKF